MSQLDGEYVSLKDKLNKGESEIITLQKQN